MKFLVEIKEVTTKKELKRFIQFPNRLYANEPNWTPDLLSDEMMNLRKDKNPAFEYCEARYFMAYRNGESVGRIAGILSYKANQTWNQNRMRFSRLDFIDDDEVVDALFDAVIRWAREKGCTELHGPIGFCDMDKEGMLIDGFEEPNLFFTMYHFPYYLKQLTRLGFEKATDWLEFRVYVPEQIPERLSRLSDVVLRRQKLTKFEFSSKRELEPKIESVFRLINDAYQHLYGVVELTPAQIQHYVKQFLPFVQPDFLPILLDQSGEVAAFGLLMPQLGEACKKGKGRLFPIGWYYFLKALRTFSVMDMYLVAVRPDLQNCGVDAILMTEMIKAAQKHGVRYAETGPELETNLKIQGLWKNFHAEQHKRRRCFIKTL